ncbi:MAG: alpha/beta hydrolase [Actinomycetota bacterium]|nr:alpha/beta hydrolase [Actinomycetota bacterium]MDA8360166.1 alpha/beta hydrolase [Actinomycetota bacterium]
MSEDAVTIRRGYVDVPWGQLHFARCGEGNGAPVAMAHQTPRSWDEYRDVLPLLGRDYDTVALDTPGFGASDLDPRAGDSIEHYADGLTLLIDELGLDQVALVGHHTGALVTLEVAVRCPTRVRAVVLSSAPLRSADERAAALAGPGVDDVTERPDGSHLTELWRRRLAFYPAGRSDLLRRFVADALRVGSRAEEGHRAVNRYPAPERAEELRRTGLPVLVLVGSADPFAYPMLARWREALPDAKVIELATGMVPLPDQLPVPFAAAVAEFLRALDEREEVAELDVQTPDTAASKSGAG